jgi:DNA-binding IclR family transcriptional regulator
MTDRLAQALDRSLAIIDCLAEGELSFGALRERSGDLPPPTFTRLVKALVASGILAGGKNGYRLAPRFLQTARGTIGGLGEGDLLKPVLAELAEATGESAAFYALRQGRVILVATHEMPESQRYMLPGGSVPEATRHGFVMAAVMRSDIATQKAAWQACPYKRDCAWTMFRDQLAEARRRGVSVELGTHRPGVMRVAANIGANPCRGSIGISSARCEANYAKTITPHILRAAQAAERILGAHL